MTMITHVLLGRNAHGSPAIHRKQFTVKNLTQTIPRKNRIQEGQFTAKIKFR